MVEYMNKSVCDISMTGYKHSYRMAGLVVQIHRHIDVVKWFNLQAADCEILKQSFLHLLETKVVLASSISRVVSNIAAAGDAAFMHPK